MWPYQVIFVLLCSSAFVSPVDVVSDKDKDLTQVENTNVNKNVTTSSEKNYPNGVPPQKIYMEGGIESNLAKNNSSSVVTSISPVPLKEKDISPSSITARKGVDLNAPLTNDNIPLKTDYFQNKTSQIDSVKVVDKANLKNSTVTYKVNEISDQNTTSTREPMKSTSKKPPPHKPTVTIPIEEAFPNATLDMKNKSKIVLSLSSEKSEKKDISSEKSSHLNMSRAQPGFIVPLVISIFAVPMLGFIGYQAVKRGKEAWKNRHYRRMDFLIDGMYND